ncbi:hypothetical protein AAP_00118 [Ascosphaera apis ARSEF 7405]|uniref:Uncharacterized protein n=1 Tax=Ascosphaera apis ARSEF 7405 TaxID=392613 RepID=A0A168DL06_9EURO|nr:hypothetical protein AAP_00118 [Ascosphaera apis ARSEF 7405]
MPPKRAANALPPFKHVTRRTSSMQSQRSTRSTVQGVLNPRQGTQTQVESDSARRTRWTSQQLEALLSWMENNHEIVTGSSKSTAAISRVVKDQAFKDDGLIDPKKIKEKMYHLYHLYKDCRKMLNQTGQGVTREDNASNIGTIDQKIARKCPYYERLELIYCDARNRATGSNCDSLISLATAAAAAAAEMAPAESVAASTASANDGARLREVIDPALRDDDDSDSDLNVYASETRADETADEDHAASRSRRLSTIRETPLDSQRRSASLMPPPPLPARITTATPAPTVRPTPAPNARATPATFVNPGAGTTRSRAQNMRSDQRVQRHFAQYVGTREERLEQAERRERIRVEGQIQMARIFAESQERMWQASERIVNRVIDMVAGGRSESRSRRSESRSRRFESRSRRAEYSSDDDISL